VDCIDAEHTAPPYWGAVTTERVWNFVPPPHVAEHSDQDDQLDMTQSIGQWWVLHGSWSCSVGHSTPPHDAGVMTARERDLKPARVPLVHGSEHVENEDHAPNSQFTAQQWVLHACCFVSPGHSKPPKRGAVVTTRTACCRPPPHGAEHEPHAP